jgi:hypothetical protein
MRGKIVKQYRRIAKKEVEDGGYAKSDVRMYVQKFKEIDKTLNVKALGKSRFQATLMQFNANLNA